MPNASHHQRAREEGPFAIAVVLALVSASCSSAGPGAESDSADKAMSSPAAVRKVKELVEHSHVLNETPPTIRGFEFERDRFKMTIADPANPDESLTCTLKYGSDTPLRVWNQSEIFFVPYFYDRCANLHWHSPESADEFSGALARLESLSAAGQLKSDKDSQAEFDRVAADYRAARVKPRLSAEGRRCEARADTAFGEKRYAEAIDAYQTCLEAAPWWASGHYKSAVLFGELSSYNDAVGEMRKYLALEPGAPDAAACREKLALWEAKAQRGLSDPIAGGGLSRKKAKKALGN